MEVDEQDREQVDSERESRSARKRDRGRRSKETTNAQTCDDMRMNDILSDPRCDTLSHNVMCAQRQICLEKLSCEVYLSTASGPVPMRGVSRCVQSSQTV